MIVFQDLSADYADFRRWERRIFLRDLHALHAELLRLPTVFVFDDYTTGGELAQ